MTPVPGRSPFSICNLALALLYGLAAAPLHGAALPAFTADYKVLRNSLPIGRSRVTLQPETGGSFLYESVTTPIGVLAWFRKDRIREYSRWVHYADHLRPLEYRYERSGSRDERVETLHFDWSDASVQQTGRDPAWRINIPAGTLDKVTMKIALMLDLQRQRKVLEYTIADDAKLRHYRFEIMGRETVSTPAGDFDAIRLLRIRDQKNRSTQLWCTPELHYLPVRIQQEEDDGTKYRSLLEDFSPELRRL